MWKTLSSRLESVSCKYSSTRLILLHFNYVFHLLRPRLTMHQFVLEHGGSAERGRWRWTVVQYQKRLFLLVAIFRRREWTVAWLWTMGRRCRSLVSAPGRANQARCRRLWSMLSGEDGFAVHQNLRYLLTGQFFQCKSMQLPFREVSPIFFKTAS